MPGSEPAVRVSTLEVFFDLVFVFTVTQLTTALGDHFNFVGLLQVLLMLGVIWWMYGGYAWLTNAVAPTSSVRRTLLLTGMAGFLVIALAIPEAFAGAGWAFGAGYLLVSLMHTMLFLRGSNPDTAQFMRRLAPLNFISASLILAGGITTGGWRYGLWVAAFAVQIATPYLYQIGAHTIVATHFAERHGLLIIIALGESIVAIGLGVRDLRLDAGVITAAVLGMCMAYLLWAIYFGGDDVRAEHALDAVTDPLRRARMALYGWGFAHYPMLLGIVILAAGVKKAVPYTFEPLKLSYALAIGAGAALFLLGHVWFRRVLHLHGGGIGGDGFRLACVAVALLSIPLGTVLAVAQLAVFPILLTTALTIYGIKRSHRTGQPVGYVPSLARPDPTAGE